MARYILHSPGLVTCRCVRLSSNVRPHNTTLSHRVRLGEPTLNRIALWNLLRPADGHRKPLGDTVVKKHLGSTLCLILGVLTFAAGTTQPGAGALLIAGPVMILGALAYRSAKKRYLGDVKNSTRRRSLEVAAVMLSIAAVAFQSNLAERIQTDPVPNLLIPLWAVLAYAAVGFRSPKQAPE